MPVPIFTVGVAVAVIRVPAWPSTTGGARTSGRVRTAGAGEARSGLAGRWTEEGGRVDDDDARDRGGPADGKGDGARRQSGPAEGDQPYAVGRRRGDGGGASHGPDGRPADPTRLTVGASGPRSAGSRGFDPEADAENARGHATPFRRAWFSPDDWFCPRLTPVVAAVAGRQVWLEAPQWDVLLVRN